MTLEEASPAILGVVSLAVGLAFRLGRRRGAARWYFDEKSPWYIRNFAFGILPASGFWLLSAAALAVQGFVARWVVWLLAAAGLFFGLVAIVSMYRPPEVMKPAWLREEERQHGPVRGPEHGRGVGMVVDRFGLVMMLVLLGGAFLASILMVAIEVVR